LEGKEAADKYLMDNIQVPELRTIAVENALAAKHYPLAEKLCDVKSRITARNAVSSHLLSAGKTSCSVIR